MVVLIFIKFFLSVHSENELFNLPIAPREQKPFLNGSLESFSKNRILIKF